MIAEFHDHLGRPERRPCTRLVVYDAHDNPVACILELADGREDVRVCGQPGFEQALRHLGVTATALVTTLTRAQIKPPGLD